MPSTVQPKPPKRSRRKQYFIPDYSPFEIDSVTNPPHSSKSHRWPVAVAGGLLFAFFIFCFLAWLQPSVKDSKRVKLPELIKVNFRITPDKKKAAPPPKTTSKPKRTEQAKRRRPRNKQQQTSLKPQAVRSTRNVSQAQALRPANIQGLGNISTLNAGVGGGGAAIALSGAQGFQSIAGEVLEMVNYNERRRAIRDSSFARTDRSAMQKLQESIQTRPRATYTPKPRYPKQARVNDVEGFVKLRFLISTTGSIEEYEIIMSQPENAFEEAIKEVLPRWQFNPAKDRTGKPIEFWMTYTYVFKMEDA